MSFADALAMPDQPRAAFEALARLAHETVGARLFTVMRFDARTREARRLHSNRPDAYPAQGTKPAPENDWAERVLERREVFVANDRAGLAAVFPDHELIASLGCEAVLNLPVVAGGAVLGTLNCLDAAGAYTPDRVAAADALRLPGAAALLLERTLNGGP